MIYYKVNKNLNGQKILADIQRLITDHNKTHSLDTNSTILYIGIKNITSDNTNIIPKLTYKPQ